jgi:hypothetical protein
MNILFKFISVVLHPIFIPFYVTIIYVSIFNNVLSDDVINYILTLVILGTFILPIFTIFLLKFIGVIDSIVLPNIKDRYIPIISSGIYIYITAKLLLTGNFSGPLNNYLIGIVVTLSWVLIFSRRMKVSLHASSLSSALGFVIYISDFFLINLLPVIILLIILIGVVSTSRIKLKAHNHKEIATGIIFGILPQLGFVYSYIK